MSTPENELRDIDERAVPPQSAPPRPPQAYPGDDRWSRKVASYVEDPRRKSPALAMILSLMPGLGQIYVGYYQQGFTNILVVSLTITLLANQHQAGVEALAPLLGVFLAFYWMYNIVDAGRRAAFYNHALSGLEKAELPKDMELPTVGGSMAGGVVLIVLGLIIFSNTMFNVSLAWLEQWWPIALIAGGAYLIYRSIQDRRPAQ